MAGYRDALKQKAGLHTSGTPRSSGSIPPVNPDPRPPNEPKAQGKGRDNQSKKHHGNDGHGTKHHGGKGNDKPSPSGATNNGNGKPEGATGFAAPEDPRDSQYWQDMIRLQSQRNFAAENVDVENVYRNTSYMDAMGQLARQEPNDLLNYKEDANRSGGLYSSKTAEGLGNISTNYFESRQGLGRDFQRDSALTALSGRSIDAQYNTDQNQALIDATGRQSAAELNRPAPGSNAIAQILKKLLKDRANGKGGGKGKGKGKNK